MASPEIADATWDLRQTIAGVRAEREALQRAELEGWLTPEARDVNRRLVDVGDLGSLPQPSWLVADVLPAYALAVLYGRQGTAKSFLAMDWALSVATGAWWQGREVTKGGVLYVAAEGASGLHCRVTAWKTARNIDQCGDLKFHPAPINLLNDLWLAGMVEVVDARQPVLVVIDTLARNMIGGDENSARDVGLAVNAADGIRQVSMATVLLVHHSGIDGSRPRGSSALEGAADAIIECKRDGDVVGLRCIKAKDAEPFPDIHLHRVKVADSLVLESHGPVGLTDEMVESERALLGVLWDSFGTTGASSTDLREVADLPKSTFYRALNSLLARGEVVNLGTEKRPHYRRAKEDPPA